MKQHSYSKKMALLSQKPRNFVTRTNINDKTFAYLAVTFTCVDCHDHLVCRWHCTSHM